MYRKSLTRRRFMTVAAAGVGATLCSLPLERSAEAAPVSDHEALAYEKLDG
ncbi:MAG: twin-arginine translocation signal domain-containing protein, partial [Candidatus Brocadiae bacterium]|nr:twin-arginine translocation signal domain-containing protein [Candidatus Brocadiia bacterium]